jgi:hypothetical protein
MVLKKNYVVFGGVFVFLALIMSAMAGDVSGTWTAETPLFTHTMVFKVDGTVLTGTVRTRQADETEIKEGKIEGNKISFYIIRMSRKVLWKGVVEGDQIRFTRDEGASVIEVIAKRLRPDTSLHI